MSPTGLLEGGARLLDFKFIEEDNGKEARVPTGHVGALNERRR